MLFKIIDYFLICNSCLTPVMMVLSLIFVVSDFRSISTDGTSFLFSK